MGPDTVHSVLRRLDLRGVSDPAGRLPRPDIAGEEDRATVRALLERVRSEGDAALLELTERFDGVALATTRVPAEELTRAYQECPPPVRSALEAAADSILAYHRSQVPRPEDFTNPMTGVSIRSTWSPVRRAGCYVPGGRAAYPSTLLMTALPARAAGVEEVVVCVPPAAAFGGVASVTLAAAAVAGVSEVHAVGGAQAVAALAYGTAGIAPVDVICGPGNRYVALAKQEVAGQVGIASAFAGPSEIVVIADASVPAAFAAVDVIVQAEHGPDGLAWLISWDPEVLQSVDAEIATLVDSAPRASDIRATLASAGIAVLVDGPEEALAVSDLIAPEHLQLMCEGGSGLAKRVRNAGAVFVGAWAPASAGDYLAGPSHVLPTHGSARFSSALTVHDFLRHHHTVDIDETAFARIGPHLEVLAEAEGLDAHAESARLRLRALAANPGVTGRTPGDGTDGEAGVR